MTEPSGDPGDGLRQEWVGLPGGRPRLAVRTADGPGRAFLLVHGLASNARLWDGVAAELLRAGHRVVAVDQRGHGLSEEPAGGYDTDTCADDLAALIDALGLAGTQGAAVVAGQSWGGNVVLSLAARHPGRVAAVCCVDGGWIRLSEAFTSFEQCWAVLAPPRLDGLRYEEVEARIRTALDDWPPEGVEATLANLVRLPDGGVRARLRREHHRDIVASLYAGDPAEWYPRIQVPVLLCPATGPQGPPPDGPAATAPAADRAHATREAVAAAHRLLPRGEVSWYPGAHHDLHAQQPRRLAEDLRRLAVRAGCTQEEEA
ncbi:MAG TPA: alpha/beta hydrolase [Kineosporiaceae bacterium]|nr:alpha/beta hydrolase [Kineosporiaceae bacterium]